MESLIDKTIRRLLQSEESITHKDILNPLFLSQKRTEAIDEIKSMNPDITEQIHQAYVKRLETELEILITLVNLTKESKGLLSKILYIYTKENQLYSIICGSAAVQDPVEIPETAQTSADELYKWVHGLSDATLTTVAHLVANLQKSSR